MSKWNFLFVFFTLFAIGLVFYFPMLRFGLTSDHLEAIYEWRGRFIVPSINSFKAFINPYGASALLDKIIDWVWGFNPLPYFLIAYITKIFASTSLYALSKYVFRSRIIAITTSIASILLFAGIQATVPGATIYISLTLFCLGLLNLFKKYREPQTVSTKSSLVISLLFIASFAITPARMYGIIPMLFFIEVYSLILRNTKLTQVVVRLGFFFIVFLLFKRIGLIDSYGTATGVASAVTSISYYQKIANLPGQLVFMLASFFQTFFPDIFVKVIAQLGYVLHLTRTTVFLVSLIPGVILFRVIQRSSTLPKFWSLISILFHSALVLVLINNLSSIDVYTQITIYLGGIIANALFYILVTLIYTKHKLSTLSIGVFGAPLIFMFVPYLLYPLETQETLSRYFAASSFFGAIISGIIIYIIRQKNLRFGTIALGVWFLILFYNGMLIHNYYVSAGEDGTYQKYLSSTFNVMNSEIGSRHGKSRPLVFIRGDSPNFISTTILNQGSLRFSLTNDDLSENSQPIFITDLKKLELIYTNKAREPYKNVTDINAVYGFEVKDKKVYSITPEIRAYLLKVTR